MIGSHLKHQILSTFYFEKTLSIVELSSKLDKSVPHVTKALTELVEAGIIKEKGDAPFTGGRKPIMDFLKVCTLYIVVVTMYQLYLKITNIDIFNSYRIP